MNEIKCDACGYEMDVELEPGAILFSPPDQNGMCKKRHICSRCYVGVFKRLFNTRNESIKWIRAEPKRSMEVESA